MKTEQQKYAVDRSSTTRIEPLSISQPSTDLLLLNSKVISMLNRVS